VQTQRDLDGYNSTARGGSSSRCRLGGLRLLCGGTAQPAIPVDFWPRRSLAVVVGRGGDLVLGGVAPRLILADLDNGASCSQVFGDLLAGLFQQLVLGNGVIRHSAADYGGDLVQVRPGRLKAAIAGSQGRFTRHRQVLRGPLRAATIFSPLKGLDARQDKSRHRLGLGGLETNPGGLIPSRLVLGPDLEFKASAFGHAAQLNALRATIALDEGVRRVDLGDETHRLVREHLGRQPFQLTRRAKGDELLLHPGRDLLGRREWGRPAPRRIGALLARPRLEVLEEVEVDRLERGIGRLARGRRQAFLDAVVGEQTLSSVQGSGLAQTKRVHQHMAAGIEYPFERGPLGVLAPAH